MIDNGLIPKILNLIDTIKTVDALLILSIIVERLHETIQVLIPQNFTEKVIDLAGSSSYQIKRMGTYFVATIVFCMDQAFVSSLITSDAIDLLVEMLDSGQNNVTLRCLQALGNMTHIAVSCNKSDLFASILNGTEIFHSLEALGENRLSSISDRALSLYTKLHSYFYLPQQS